MWSSHIRGFDQVLCLTQTAATSLLSDIINSDSALVSVLFKDLFLFPQQIVIYGLLFVLRASSLTIQLIAIICYSALVQILGMGAVK